MKLFFRHENFRKGQEEITTSVQRALESGRHLLLHAPTGCGKTDAVLSPTFSFALEHNLTVFFLTPKTSQHAVAIDCVKGICKKNELREAGVDFVGKRQLCLNEGAKESGNFYLSCSMLSKERKCAFLEEWRRNGSGKKFSDSIGFHEALEFSREKRVCPYEFVSESARRARVIVCDYNHLLLPFIRTSFLKRVGKTLEDSIVIVDEAHNLWERTRQELSSSLKPQSLERAEKELKENDLPSAGLKKIRKELKSLAEAKLGKTQFGESLVSRQEFFDCLEQEPGDFVEAMEESARKTVLRGGRRSNCGAIAEFVESWVASDETRFARIISPESLELKCLDASEETKALNCARSCVSMSGTLLPLEMHRDLLGFDGERTDLLEFKSPFPQSNRLNLIETGVTTRFSKRSPTEFEKIASKIQELIDAMKGRELAVFFPSFSVLERIIPLISSQNLVVQRGESGAVEKEQTIKEFRESRGVLCAVLGGALSEGIDYDKQEIKCIAIVGIPFAEISLEQQKLVEYLQKKFGKGWDYGYVLPAMNKALQAAGRGIRSERDKCAVIFMDERYSWVNYRKFFPSDFEAQATRSPWIEVKKFLGN